MRSALILIFASVLVFTNTSASEPPKVITLWPGPAPGDKGDIGEEQDTTKASDHMVAGKRVARIGNVSKPTISIYRPPVDKNTGAAVMVCPGGAYRILALDLEGSEVCEWLNSIGITGVLLKYRVPNRAGLEKHAVALQDAQRALGLIRSQAKELGINAKRVGVLGFSAGGHLAASVSNNYDQRTYPKVDAADDTSCRPDFTLLIYPAYLTIKEENDKIAPELKVITNTPPTFIAMTEDDPLRVETPMFYSLALRKANVPFELHLYPKGGHGYGLRPSQDSVSTWPQRAGEWMNKLNLTSPP